MRRSNTNRIPPQRRQLAFEPLEPRQLLAADAGFDWWSDDWSWTFDDTTVTDDSWTYAPADDAAWDDSWWVGDDSDSSWAWEFDTTDQGWPTEAGGEGEWLDDDTTTTDVAEQPSQVTPVTPPINVVAPLPAAPEPVISITTPVVVIPPQPPVSQPAASPADADVAIMVPDDEYDITSASNTDGHDVRNSSDPVVTPGLTTGDTADESITSDHAPDVDQSDEAPKAEVSFCGVPHMISMPEFLTYVDPCTGESYPVHVDDISVPVPGSGGAWPDCDDVTFDWHDVTSEFDESEDVIIDPVIPSDASPIVVTATMIPPSTAPVVILPPSTVGTGLPGTSAPLGNRFAGLGGFFWQAFGRQTGTVDGVAIGEAPSGSGRPRSRLPFRPFG